MQKASTWTERVYAYEGRSDWKPDGEQAVGNADRKRIQGKKAGTKDPGNFKRKKERRQERGVGRKELRKKTRRTERRQESRKDKN